MKMIILAKELLGTTVLLCTVYFVLALLFIYPFGEYLYSLEAVRYEQADIIAAFFLLIGPTGGVGLAISGLLRDVRSLS